VVLLFFLNCDGEKYRGDSFKFYFSSKIENGFIEVSAKGTSKGFGGLSENNQRDVAEEVAFISAVEKLSEILFNVKKGDYPESTIKKNELYDEIKTEINNIEIVEKSFKRAERGYMEALVTIRYPLESLKIDNFFTGKFRFNRKTIKESPGRENDFYTGLIINLTGCGKPPPISQSFQIYSNDGRLIFGTETINTELILKGEGVHFRPNLDSALEMKDIVGNNPFIINYKYVIKDKIIISEKDAEIILENNIVKKFLERTRIILVI